MAVKGIAAGIRARIALPWVLGVFFNSEPKRADDSVPVHRYGTNEFRHKRGEQHPMSKLDEALARINSAMDRLENVIDTRVGETVWGDVDEEAPDLRMEHGQLQDEVKALRARAAEDAKLRAEAADAVREALSDLRGAMTRNMDKGAPANA